MRLLIHKDIRVSPDQVKRLLKEFKLEKEVLVAYNKAPKIGKVLLPNNRILFLIRKDRDPIKQIRLILASVGKKIGPKKNKPISNAPKPREVPNMSVLGASEPELKDLKALPVSDSSEVV